MHTYRGSNSKHNAYKNTIEALAICYVGGRGSIWGSILSAFSLVANGIYERNDGIKANSLRPSNFSNAVLSGRFVWVV